MPITHTRVLHSENLQRAVNSRSVTHVKWVEGYFLLLKDSDSIKVVCPSFSF
jgi:hypothetical protein